MYRTVCRAMLPGARTAARGRAGAARPRLKKSRGDTSDTRKRVSTWALCLSKRHEPHVETPRPRVSQVRQARRRVDIDAHHISVRHASWREDR